MATTVARLQAVLSADTGAFDKKMDKSESRMGKMGKAAGVAGAAIAGGLVVGLVKSVKAAEEAEVSQTKMESALKSVGISYGAHKKHIDDVIQSTSKLAALDDEELQDAFTRIARATGDVNTALKDTRLAADIARGANISLEAATKAVVNTELGRATGLRKLGVAVSTVTANQDEMKAAFDQFKKTHKVVTAEEDNRWKRLIDTAKAQDKAKTSQDALTLATQKYGGASKAFGDTAAGSQERFKVALENVEESLGQALLPALTKVFTLIAKGTEWLSEHEGVTKVLVIAIGLLATALIAASVAQTLLNLAVLANPFVALGVALIAAGVAIYVFRDQIMEVFFWIKDNWPLLTAIIVGPIGIAVYEVYKHFDELKDLAEKVWGYIAAIGTTIAGKISEFAAWGANVGDGIRNAVVSAITGIGQAAWNIVNNIADYIGSAGSKLSIVTAWGANVGNWVKNAAVGAVTGIGQAVWGLINNVGDYVADRIDTVTSWGSKIGNAIKSGVVGGLRGLAGIVGRIATGAVNALARAWNAFKIPGFKIHIPVPFAKDIDFDTPDINFPNIPLLAGGGIVRRPTLAMLGESGPEAVVPLGKGGGAGVIVNVYGNVLTERELVDAVYQGLLKKQTGGRLGIT